MKMYVCAINVTKMKQPTTIFQAINQKYIFDSAYLRYTEKSSDEICVIFKKSISENNPIQKISLTTSMYKFRKHFPTELINL